jgi:hypothetical protein
MRNRRLILLASLLFILIPMMASAQLISFSGSNQYISTLGFETNAFDWMLNPLDFGKLQSSTLAFSLDGAGDQFGVGTAGYGIRGGYAWLMDGFSPILFMDYKTTAQSTTESETDNTSVAHSGYDEASGRYGTVTQSVSITMNDVTPAQNLMAQFGGKLNAPVNFDVQLEWLLDTITMSTLSYTDTYSNTSSPTEDTLTSKGDRTETSYSMRNLGSTNNALAVEGEGGLVFNNLTSRISLGVGLMNWDFGTPTYQSVTTTYSSGIDSTVRDEESYSIMSGAYAYSGGAIALFGMNTSMGYVSYLPYIPVSLDSATTLAFDDTFKLMVPFSFTYKFTPALSTVETSRTVLYDDSDANNRETSRIDGTTTVALSFSRNMAADIGAGVQKSFTRDSATLHLGATLDVDYTGWQATRTSTNSVHTQADGNADGDYTDAGTDTDTTYTLSGYEVESSSDTIKTSVTIPVAVSYSPVSALSFHAGASTTLYAKCVVTASLVTGDSGYCYQTYTDNLVAGNSYAQRPLDASDSSSVPASNVAWNFGVSADATFGVTLQLAEGFVIDALATGSTAGFDSFSLMGTYSF